MLASLNRATQALGSWASAVVAHLFSCPTARGSPQTRDLTPTWEVSALSGKVLEYRAIREALDYEDYF